MASEEEMRTVEYWRNRISETGFENAEKETTLLRANQKEAFAQATTQYQQMQGIARPERQEARDIEALKTLKSSNAIQRLILIVLFITLVVTVWLAFGKN